MPKWWDLKYGYDSSTTASVINTVLVWRNIVTADTSTALPTNWTYPDYGTGMTMNASNAEYRFPIKVWSKEEIEKEAAASRKITILARRKGKQLVRDLFNKEQRKQFREMKCITVEGNLGGKYVISPGHAQRAILPDGTIYCTICYHIDREFNTEDQLVAESLDVQYQEENIRKYGNWHKDREEYFRLIAAGITQTPVLKLAS